MIRHSFWYIIPLTLWAVYRFRRYVLNAIIWLLVEPPFDRSVKPGEMCYCCGARDGKLKAVRDSVLSTSDHHKERVPGSKDNASETLLVQYVCNVCGAVQHFSPIVPQNTPLEQAMKAMDHDGPLRVGSVAAPKVMQ